MVRWHARRLGDAFAWVLLDLDRSAIYPFSDNAPVPIPQKSHGSEGLLAISAYLAKEGWGFPLLHDITDVLRIGDVTFIERGSQSHRTLEVKTRHLGTATEENGEKSTRYDVNITFLESRNTEMESVREQLFATHQADSPNEEVDTTRQKADRRIAQQTRRMSKALTLKEADLDKVFEVDGIRTIATKLDSPTEPHWDAVKNMIREAKEAGYASAHIDGAFAYIALYSDSGVTPEMTQNLRITEDVKKLATLPPGAKQRNSLSISSIPNEESRGAHLYLPFYLYSIPSDAISDLLHGRLVIIALTNPGKIAEAIEQDGVEVEIPTGRDPLSSMTLSHTITDSSGRKYRVEGKALDLHIRECIHEFLGVDYIRSIVRQMRETWNTAVDEVLRHRSAEDDAQQGSGGGQTGGQTEQPDVDLPGR